jgi:hypothetical protein
MVSYVVITKAIRCTSTIFGSSTRALVLVIVSKGERLPNPRFFPNEQGSSSVHTHQPISQPTSYSNDLEPNLDQQ